MRTYLLWTDPHFTDSPVDEYRWDVFKHILRLSLQHKVKSIVCLGDLVDRKDRHSSVLVNRLIEEFSFLQIQTEASIFILSGNHDKPLNGPYYWKFLDKLGIEYITKPRLHDNIWFLPFSANPAKEWENIYLKKSFAVFMHQTGQGAIVERDRELVPHNLPPFPDNVKVFSGDVHRPQTSNGIFYIGTPHPIKFSETWPNRVVVIEDGNFDTIISHWIPSIKRAILDISSSKDLSKSIYKKGDQLRIRYALTGKQLVNWGEEQQAIKEWADKRGVYIASIEGILSGDGVNQETSEKIQSLEIMKPEEVVKQFGEDEKLSNEVIDMGVELLKGI